MSNYSDKLQDPRWQRKRLEIMKRDKFKCVKCKDKKTTLHIHHKVRKKGLEPWGYNNSDLATLCKDCHREIELIKEYDKLVKFDEIKIFKRISSPNKILIMFSSSNNLCRMSIYSNEDCLIAGFNLDKDIIPEIINILKAAL